MSQPTFERAMDSESGIHGAAEPLGEDVISPRMILRVIKGVPKPLRNPFPRQHTRWRGRALDGDGPNA